MVGTEEIRQNCSVLSNQSVVSSPTSPHPSPQRRYLSTDQSVVDIFFYNQILVWVCFFGFFGFLFF